MPRYIDELDLLKEQEVALRQAIARRLAEEAGHPTTADPTPDQVDTADAAIAAWAESDEEQHDLAAFRPLGPLQRLLDEHRQMLDRIDDLLDRRLS